MTRSNLMLAPVGLLILLLSIVLLGCSENGADEGATPAGDWLSLSVEGSPVELSTAYDTGTVEIGTTGTTTFTVSNEGNASVSLDGTDLGIGLTGTDAGQFSLDLSSTATTLAQGESTTFGLSFSPVGDIGSRSASVTLRSDADDTAYSFDLTGTAGGAIITVALWDGEVETNLDNNDAVDYETVSGTEQRTFRIENAGNMPLSFSDILLDGPNGTDNDTPTEDSFYWDSLPNQDALAPGSTRELIVALRNQSYSGGEPASAALSINSNSLGDGLNEFTLNLSATLY